MVEQVAHEDVGNAANLALVVRVVLACIASSTCGRDCQGAAGLTCAGDPDAGLVDVDLARGVAETQATSGHDGDGVLLVVDVRLAGDMCVDVIGEGLVSDL